MSKNYGSKRIVTGAHYGLRDWLVQRVTAVLMALFTIVLLAQVLFGGPLGYDTWSGIFAQQWMKTLTFTVIVSLAWHAWIGVRDIYMDYVTKSVGLRLALQVAATLRAAARRGVEVFVNLCDGRLDGPAPTLRPARASCSEARMPEPPAPTITTSNLRRGREPE